VPSLQRPSYSQNPAGLGLNFSVTPALPVDCIHACDVSSSVPPRIRDTFTKEHSCVQHQGRYTFTSMHMPIALSNMFDVHGIASSL
jgi:hypothetical protein